jgi:predicted nucleic acid-binding Zn ribbon protein
MKQFLIKKPCPTCKASIEIGLFSIREEIVRCAKCKELLTDNPKRKQIQVIIILVGLLISVGGHYLIGISLNWGILIGFVLLLISIVVSNLTIIKKDLVIRNKQTNEISYIDKSDWNDRLVNSSGKENIFEIIEDLK